MISLGKTTSGLYIKNDSSKPRCASSDPAHDAGVSRLLTCLSQIPTAEKLPRLKALNRDDWQAVLDAAICYTLAPALFHALNPLHPFLSIDSFMWEKMRGLYHASAARNMRLYRELGNIVRSCNEQAIPVIFLKGAHLAEFVYPNIALRPMSDVDLLVKTDDLARVHRLLIRSGYRCDEQNPGKCHLSPYRKPDGPVIEIHFNIVSAPVSRRFEIADLWKRARPASLQAAHAWLLSPEDLILHLAAHACIHHGFDNGLIPFMDICRVAVHYEGELDWDVLWNRARQWGIERSVCLMLALTEIMLGLPMPAQIGARMQSDPETLRILNTAEALIYERGTGASALVARFFDRRGRRLLFKSFFQLAFPPKEIMAGPTRASADTTTWNLYSRYLRRFASRLNEHRSTIWSALIRDPGTLRALRFENRKTELKDWLSRNGHEKGIARASGR